jgi:hypothetical protein
MLRPDEDFFGYQCLAPELEKHIAQNLAQLGFTPTDRARLGVSGIKTDGLQEFRDRIAAKRTTA